MANQRDELMTVEQILAEAVRRVRANVLSLAGAWPRSEGDPAS